MLVDPALVSIRQRWEQRFGDLLDAPIHLQAEVCCDTTDMYDDPGNRAREALEELAGRSSLTVGAGFPPLTGSACPRCAACVPPNDASASIPYLRTSNSLPRPWSPIGEEVRWVWRASRKGPVAGP